MTSKAIERDEAILFVGGQEIVDAQIAVMDEVWADFCGDMNGRKVNEAMLREYYDLGMDCTKETLFMAVAEKFREHNRYMWTRPTLEMMMGEDTLQIPIATPVENYRMGKLEHSLCVGGGSRPLIIVAENRQKAKILQVIQNGLLRNEEYREEDWDAGWVGGRVLRMPNYEGQDDITKGNFMSIPCSGDLGDRYLEWYIQEMINRKNGTYDPTMPVDELVILDGVDALIESGKMKSEQIERLMNLSGATGDVGSICVVMMMNPVEMLKILTVPKDRKMMVGREMLFGKMDEKIAGRLEKLLNRSGLTRQIGQMDESQGIYATNEGMSRQWLTMGL